MNERLLLALTWAGSLPPPSAEVPPSSAKGSAPCADEAAQRATTRLWSAAFPFGARVCFWDGCCSVLDLERDAMPDLVSFLLSENWSVFSAAVEAGVVESLDDGSAQVALAKGAVVDTVRMRAASGSRSTVSLPDDLWSEWLRAGGALLGDRACSVSGAHSTEEEEEYEPIEAGARRSSGPATRRAAVRDLLRGRTERALVMLERQQEQLQDGEQCRFNLSKAVALAAIGQLQDSLLQGLEALGWARRAHDEQGERAALRFLHHLTSHAGGVGLADGWIPDESDDETVPLTIR